MLITGASGLLGRILCRSLAPLNDVWCVARFSDVTARADLERWGARTSAVDLADPDFSELPDHFDYIVHLAAFMDSRDDDDLAIRTSAEGTGLLLSTFRTAKAALVMSTTSVYRVHEDPWHLYLESDPLGAATNRSMPTYPIAKITEEAVARTCARLFDLPVVITRLNNVYGPSGGLARQHLQAILADRPITVRADPLPFTPLFEDDVPDQLEQLLEAAAVPATIVNWGGDQAVSVAQWCAFLGEMLGKTPRFELVPVPGSQRGVAADPARRHALTGPGTAWRDGMRVLVEESGTQ